MTRRAIEPQSFGKFVNTILVRPMDRSEYATYHGRKWMKTSKTLKDHAEVVL